LPTIENKIYNIAQGLRIKLLGRVSDEELATAYSGAEALVFPSLYEGFGLPLIEAMACGCPVICSSAGSLGEVAGDAAILVSGRDPGELAAAMERVADPSVRQRLVAAGLERAKRFRWDETARRVREAIESVAAHR
jgi:glycosyltransferase involved in cell wall biosynthesis